MHLEAQDGSKTSPRPKKRGTKTMKNRGVCWEPPRRRGTPSDRARKSDGVPLPGSVFRQFFDGFSRVSVEILEGFRVPFATVSKAFQKEFSSFYGVSRGRTGLKNSRASAASERAQRAKRAER